MNALPDRELCLTYPFYGEGEEVESLSFIYTHRGCRDKLVEVRDKDERLVRLVHVWINGIPAAYLKGFRSSILPQEFTQSTTHQKKGSDYFLNFDNRWDWFYDKRKFRQITLHIEGIGPTFSIKTFGCCRFIWIKKRLEESDCLGKPVDNEPYLLFHNNIPAQDELSLDQFGIKDVDTLEVTTATVLKKGISPLQKATGGTYVSIKDFKSYMRVMAQKIDIVCQVHISGINEYGTGFLIGHYLIMTNAHVIKDGLRKAKAIFLYHDDSQTKQIKLPLYEYAVSLSPSPDQKFPEGAYDYAILRLKPSRLTEKQIAILSHLNQIGSNFFDQAYNRYKNNQAQGESKVARDTRIARANIVQHPLLETKDGSLVSQPKRVAFRENRVHLALSNTRLLHYETATDEGSSGSPAVNDQGEWIGLHYSACHIVNKKLLVYINELCAYFGYQYVKKDHEMYCFEKEGLQFFVIYSGNEKGSCWHTGEKGYDLQKFILQQIEKRNERVDLAEFIINFLQDQQDDTVKKEHVRCNTAIAVESIFEDLLISNPQKMKAKIEEGELADREWFYFSRLNPTEMRQFDLLEDKMKSLFLTLSAKEKKLFFILDNNTQVSFSNLPKEYRFFFLQLSKNEQQEFLFCNEKEKKDFIAAKQKSETRYKWCAGVGLTLTIAALVGFCYLKYLRKK